VYLTTKFTDAYLPQTAASTANLGNGTAMGVIQPTLAVNYIIKVKANTTGAGGVVSWGGLIGDIATDSSLRAYVVGGVNYAGLATQPDSTMLANTSGITAEPVATTNTQWLDYTCGSTQGMIMYRGAGAWSCLPPDTVGKVLSTNGPSANPSWIAATGTGTVQSVALAAPSIFSVSGSPVTTTGTLTFAPVTQAANTVWAGPASGSAATPGFRSLVGADLPNPSSSTLGGVRSFASVSHTWLNAISTSGVPSGVQPSFSDLLSQATLGQLPNLTADSVYLNATGSSTTPTAVALPNCSAGITYNTSTHALGCSSSGGTGFVDLTKSPYSAACNGAPTSGTDDSTAIQSWLNALPTGGVGYIPPGKTCLFNGIITVPSNVQIYAPNAVLMAKSGANANTCLCLSDATQAANGPTNVYIYGLTVDGNVANRTGGSAANIFISAAQKILLDNVTVQNSSGSADCISVGGNSSSARLSTDITIRSYLLSTCARNGIAVFGASRVHIATGRITGAVASPGHAIDLEPANANELDSNIVINDLFCNGNGAACIAVDPSTVASGVNASMAMNVIASGNCVNGGTCQDFMQYIAPATKAGFRFINANGTFGGTVPAVDALP
jgi:hypothetical protein